MHPPSSARPWLLIGLLSIVLAGVALFRPLSTTGQRENDRNPSTEQAETQSLTLIIQFAPGNVRTFAQQTWRKGMTVADLMEEARLVQPPLTYSQRGSGTQAFLTAIDGVANHPEKGMFWLYEINGERATRSFGVQPLKPGDRVLWVFGAQE